MNRRKFFQGLAAAAICAGSLVRFGSAVVKEEVAVRTFHTTGGYQYFEYKSYLLPDGAWYTEERVDGLVVKVSSVENGVITLSSEKENLKS